MPAKDFIHDAVRNALIKDGWSITADPYELAFEEYTLSVDMAAEKILEVIKEQRRVLIEVKSFLGRSFIKDFQTALGQYQVYKGFLEAKRIQEPLYIAVSDIVYERFFKGEAIQMLVERYEIRLLVVDVEQEKVILWID